MQVGDLEAWRFGNLHKAWSGRCPAFRSYSGEVSYLHIIARYATPQHFMPRQKSYNTYYLTFGSWIAYLVTSFIFSYFDAYFILI